MIRPDHSEAKDALDAYLRATAPTSILTLRLICALAQLLANDQQSNVNLAIGKCPPITRVPKNLTFQRRYAS
jgi:hypothetical protein